MVQIQDIEETLSSLMDVFHAAKEFIEEPSAIYKARRIEELKKAIYRYEETYNKRFPDNG